jgi:hypothetical protein
MLPTVSSWPRIKRCLGSAVLPAAHKESGVDAEKGRAIHGFLAEVGNMGKEAALARVPAEYREACGAIDLDGLPLGHGYRAEVSMAIDLETGNVRELGENLNRNYPALGETEIAGTADVIASTEDSAFVIDYKTGHGYVDAPSDNIQLAVLAAMAARLQSKTRATVGIVRLRDDGSSSTFSAELNDRELNTIFNDLLGMARGVNAAREAYAQGSTPPTVEGEWCKYCPAFNSCPAKTAIARTIANPEAITREFTGLTLDQAGKVWRRIKEVEDVLDRAKEEIKAIASRTPIPLGNGRYVGIVESEKEFVDGEAAYRVLALQLGEKVARAACSVETSKTAIDKALKAHGSGTLSHSAVKEMVMEKIRQAGGMRTKFSKTVREFSKAEQE